VIIHELSRDSLLVSCREFTVATMLPTGYSRVSEVLARVINSCVICNEIDNFQSTITLLLSVRIVKFKNSVVGDRPNFFAESKLLGEMKSILRYGPLFKGLTSNMINFMKE
jgi:hypothetical protein